MHDLPETHFHKASHNPVQELFYGRLELRLAFALLFFDKGSKYRKLIYQLKYKGKKEAGTFLGKLIGSRLHEIACDKIDGIIPVPLHKIKKRRRGYNQSLLIAEGVSSVIERPVFENVLHRKIHTTTQTRKERFDRWKNVEDIFYCSQPDKLKGKHILLIDDVVTTGSTLEAAGSVLQEINGTSVSIATAAYASL
jgi:ComF family protein